MAISVVIASVNTLMSMEPTRLHTGLTLPILFEFTNVCGFLLQLNRYISAILDISPFPVFGLLLLMSCSARLICVVSSSSDESAIQHFAKLHGIATTQLQCVTDKQLMEMLDSGVAQFDIIMAPLVDPSGELKETTFNMIPALRYKYFRLPVLTFTNSASDYRCPSI